MGKTGTFKDEPENGAQKDATQAISILICMRNMMYSIKEGASGRETMFLLCALYCYW